MSPEAGSRAICRRFLSLFVMTAPAQARILKRGEFVIWGSIGQVIGLLLCITIVGALIGLPLMVLSTKWSYRYYCSQCGRRVSATKTEACPQCGAEFSKTTN